ncbi:MAG TPA: class I SAM-dependent methyltransferase [Solirubrobacterales bacterium]|nr:class I SAM-dependent methyltransferase [Solirubrobacterales bacterium]
MSAPPLTPLAAAVLHVSPAPERILELACGDGEGALFLSREFPTARVRGVDASAAAVRGAQRRVGLDPEGRVAFKRAGAREMPYPEHHFDLVVAIDASPSPALLRRALRPAGWAILATTGRPGAGLRRAWQRRRLARSGFEQVAREQAGEGEYYVGRLTGAG